MDTEITSELAVDQQANRRQIPRFDLEETATLLLLKHGTQFTCRILDLSLGGCRLDTAEQFTIRALAPVEVNFKVNGIILRFRGLTQWVDSQHHIGIQFQDLTSRRKDELAEVLKEVEADNIAKAAKLAAAEKIEADRIAAQKEADRLFWIEDAKRRAVAEQAWTEAMQAPSEALPASALSETSSNAPENALPVSVYGNTLTPTPASSAPTAPRPATPALSAGFERREQPRLSVNTRAVIHLIKIASEQRGRVVDLSLGGCRILTDEQFPVGIYTRIEVEFLLEGMTFRLGGVVQSFRNGNNVGIRFLDISDRKRAQLQHLVAEIEEMRALHGDDDEG
jgi:c-di-GMP-binding flagellar brake protein YcgR